MLNFLPPRHRGEHLPVEIIVPVYKNILSQILRRHQGQCVIFKIDIVIFNAGIKIRNLGISTGLYVEPEYIYYSTLVTQVKKVVIVHGPGMKVFAEGIGDPFQPIGGGIDVEKKKIVIRGKLLKSFNVSSQGIGDAVGAKHNGIGIGDKRRIEVIKGIIR